MQAIHFTGKGEAGLAELRMPDLPPGHVLLRVRASGLCHTDIEVLHGRYGEGAFPLVPGHEYAGTVEAAASDVAAFRPGDRVAVDPNLPCGICRACRKGLSNLCASLKAYGVTHNGGFAEYSVVKAEHLYDIGDLPFHVAALAEPLACVLNGLGAAGLNAEQTGNALVIGAGPIGLLLALSLKARGVGSVTVADINEARLAFAGDLGLEALHSASQALQTRKRHFDLTADATGIASVVETLIGFTADGGTALVFGVCAPDARISVAPFELFRRQIRLAGSHSLNRNIPEALGILRQDDGKMARLISHQLPLDGILPYFSKAGGDPSAMKIQFTAG